MDKNERNEHFQGFAMLLYQELSTIDGGHETVISEYRNKYDKQEIVQLIAQRAYDLVDHACTTITGSMINWHIEDRVHAIADLTQWPPD